MAPYGEMKRLRSENGSEYASKQFSNLILKNKFDLNSLHLIPHFKMGNKGPILCYKMHLIIASIVKPCST